MFSYLLQDGETNTESERERPDLIPDLSSESEMELQLVSHQLHLFKFIYFIGSMCFWLKSVLFVCPSEIIKHAWEPSLISVYYWGFTSWW